MLYANVRPTVRRMQSISPFVTPVYIGHAVLNFLKINCTEIMQPNPLTSTVAILVQL